MQTTIKPGRHIKRKTHQLISFVNQVRRTPKQALWPSLKKMLHRKPVNLNEGQCAKSTLKPTSPCLLNSFPTQETFRDDVHVVFTEIMWSVSDWLIFARENSKPGTCQSETSLKSYVISMTCLLSNPTRPSSGGRTELAYEKSHLICLLSLIMLISLANSPLFHLAAHDTEARLRTAVKN